jgi:hypothetical protein
MQAIFLTWHVRLACIFHLTPQFYFSFQKIYTPFSSSPSSWRTSAMRLRPSPTAPMLPFRKDDAAAAMRRVMAVDEELQKVVEDRARQEQCVSLPNFSAGELPNSGSGPLLPLPPRFGPVAAGDASTRGRSAPWPRRHPPPGPLAAGDASSHRRPNRVRSYTRPTSAMLPRVVPVVLRPAAGPRELCDALQRHLTLHPFMLPSLSFLTASTSMRRWLPCR